MFGSILRRVFGRPIDGRLSFAGRLIAIKNPTTTADAIRVSDSLTPSSASEVLVSGAIRGSIAGKPRRNEEGASDCCQVLAERMRQHGIQVVRVQRPPGPESGVDCTLHCPGGTRQVQVTRAAGFALWRELAQSGQANVDTEPCSLSNALLQTTKDKARGMVVTGVTLALDATDTPWLSMPPVADAARRMAGDFASLGFAEVWLVGPTPDFVWRLDR